MSVKDKKQTPIRLYQEQIEKIKAKTLKDGITFQKLAEVLFTAYLGGNKEINKLVKEYADDKDNKKKRYGFNTIDQNEIYRILETEHSPFKDFLKAKEELDDEE